MPNKLVDLQIKEVSGVDVTANMRKFLIVKSASQGSSLKEKLTNIVKQYLPPKNGTAMTFTQAYAYETLDDQLSDLMYDAGWALRDTIKSIMADTSVDNKIEAIQQALNEFSQVIVGSFQQVLTMAGTVTLTPAITATPITTNKRKEGKQMSIFSEDVLKNLPEDVRKGIEELQKKADQADTLQQTVTDLQKQVDELKKGAQPSSSTSPEDDIFKGMSPAAKELVMKLQKQAKEAEELAKAEKEARLNREFVTKAAELKGLNVKADEFGPVLKAVAEKCPEQFEKLEAVLKTASNAILTGEVLKEVGSSGSSSGSAWDKIEKKAEELLKGETSLSKEQAISKVIQQEPQLYEEYQKELRG